MRYRSLSRGKALIYGRRNDNSIKIAKGVSSMTSYQYDSTRKDFILLDWNVIKYLKKPRKPLDTECADIIEKIRKRYAFPFCEAHLRDLSKSYSEGNKPLIDDDLKFLQHLCRGVAIKSDGRNGAFCLVPYSASDLFQEIILEAPRETNITAKMNPQSTVQYDMEKIDLDHPMRKLLDTTDGLYNPNLMADWLNELFEPFFYESDTYKGFRNYLSKIKRDIQENDAQGSFSDSDWAYKARLQEHLMPFIESLEIENEDTLSAVWIEGITKVLQFTHPEAIPYETLITSAYVMLDLHPLFRENLKKRKNTLSNIQRDSKMIYYASLGKYFVTEDSACYDKASFLFRAIKSKTKVLKMEEFVQVFY